MRSIPPVRQYEAIVEHLRALQQEAARQSEVLSKLETRILGLEKMERELRAAPFLANPSALSNAGPFAFQADELDDAPLGFEDQFRGPRELITQRQSEYVPLFSGLSPVADLGCGRGEFLALASQAGLTAVGVDADGTAIAQAVQDGLDAIGQDALSWLRARPDGSLGGIFASHFLEHLDAQALHQTMSEAFRVLRHGGVLVAETVNPHALFAFKTFWTDPTHRTPLFPEVLLWIGRMHGFSAGRAWCPFGQGDMRQDLQNCGEYAIILHKRSSK